MTDGIECLASRATLWFDTYSEGVKASLERRQSLNHVAINAARKQRLHASMTIYVESLWLGFIVISNANTH
ncbi:unnamed protein product [Dovyalis caffra]|uniref:Uncharacterized protein n=1 Tax=Dovyalis caffra TaxID=77055 RepID=A0AAV1RFU1_9ROSI|nr:unnamed protein product [Dovyalis caffra]